MGKDRITAKELIGEELTKLFRRMSAWDIYALAECEGMTFQDAKPRFHREFIRILRKNRDMSRVQEEARFAAVTAAAAKVWAQVPSYVREGEQSHYVRHFVDSDTTDFITDKHHEVWHKYGYPDAGWLINDIRRFRKALDTQLALGESTASHAWSGKQFMKYIDILAADLQEWYDNEPCARGPVTVSATVISRNEASITAVLS